MASSLRAAYGQFLAPPQGFLSGSASSGAIGMNRTTNLANPIDAENHVGRSQGLRLPTTAECGWPVRL